MAKREVPQSLDFEIINIEPINKYISECEIKIFYVGQNRNGSYISKAVGDRIASSLPRTPIVALYDEKIDDYKDHGEEITINGDGVKFEKKTIPYGAVDQNTPAVWKKITDKNGVEKEYLVARGFLWTGRYPHLEKVLEKPKGQSMEFFEESVQGDWAKFDNSDDEVFIFNEADISALCILGDEVEPCFEDSTIGKPEFTYSLEKNEFKKEFNAFMFELDQALKYDNDNNTEGGIIVNEEEKKVVDEEKNDEENNNEEGLVIEDGLRVREDVKEHPKNPDQDQEPSTPEEPPAEGEISKFEDSVEEEAVPTEQEPEVEAEENTDETEKEVLVELPAEAEEVEEDKVQEEESEELIKIRAKYSLLEKELEDLKVEFTILKEEKESRDLSEKEEICNKFSILGEEALKPLKENLNNYTAIELEKELSVIAFQKGISFSLLSKKDAIVTPNPISNNELIPAWVRAVEKQESENY